MAYNVVTNSLVVHEIKKCRYFKINLGLASTMDKNGQRLFNDADKFAQYYNSQYNTTIYAQGNVGDIKFYNDVFIKEPMMAIYVGPTYEEFIINVDFSIISEKGIDFYLGHVLKQVEEEHEKRILENTTKKVEEKPKGNPDLITFNPGSVRYEDLKAFMEKQNAQRYSNNNNI
jgi:hypothetical protein